MMSYLWILLLGSLLATSAKAQDAQPNPNGEPGADEDTTEHSAEVIPPVVNDPEPKGDQEADAGKPADSVNVEETSDTKSEAAADGDEGTPDKAQDAPLSPEADAVPEDEQDTTNHTSEVMPPVVIAPEPKDPANGDTLDSETKSEGAPGATDPVAPAPGEADPVAPAPGATDPVAPAPGEADPVAPAPGATDPVAPAPGEADPVDPAPGEADPVDPAPGATDPVVPAPGETDSVDPAPGETDPAAPASGDTEAKDTKASGDAKPAATAEGDEDPGTPDKEPAAVPGVKEDATEPDAKKADEEVTDTKEGPAQVETQNSPGNEEKQPKADADPADVVIVPDVIQPEVRADVNAEIPPVVERPIHPQQDNTLEIEPQVAGATGEVDNTEAKESSSSTLAGILSAIIVAAVAAVVGYFMYQQKKLCFKNRQDADPEAARKADAAEAQSDPQVLSNLLNSSETNKDHTAA
ncbi:skin secretory protein xP2-like [Antennarius striatus]|uniref:skin secretory protein xP2-like n=1 Tax=Antennarius striatus TaxID=241820 RepID=UPI0035ADA546